MFDAYFHVLFPVIVAVLVNGYVFSFFKPSPPSNKYIPPGYVVGFIWVFLFGLLGYVHYLLYSNNKFVASWSIVFLLCFCIGYPFFTNGFKNKRVSKMLDVGSLILSLIVSMIVLYYSSSFNFSKY